MTAAFETVLLMFAVLAAVAVIARRLNIAPSILLVVAAVLMILTQAYLIVSGNYAWLNWITLVVLVAGISDPVFGAVSFTHGANVGFLWCSVMLLAGGLVALLFNRIRHQELSVGGPGK